MKVKNVSTFPAYGFKFNGRPQLVLPGAEAEVPAAEVKTFAAKLAAGKLSGIFEEVKETSAEIKDVNGNVIPVASTK